MIKFHYTSLNNILTFNFLLAAILPILTIGLFVLHFMTITLEKEITDKNFLLAKSLSGEVERFLEEPLNLLKQAEIYINQKENIDEINFFFNSLIKTYKLFEMIMVLDPKGYVQHIVPYDENLFGIDMSGQDFFKKNLKHVKTYWSPTFISVKTGHPTISVSIASKNAIIVGYLDLSTLNDVINKIKFGLYGYAAITDFDGTIIAHPNRLLVLERFNIISLKSFDQALKGNDGTYRYFFQGIEKIGSTVIVPKTKWIIVISQHVKEIFSPVKIIRFSLLSGSVLSFALAILLAFLSLKKTLKPLEKLTQNIKKVANGDYNALIRCQTYREIDELTNSFNIMIKTIKNRESSLMESEEKIIQLNMELEHRVAERTTQLEAVNTELKSFCFSVSHDLYAPLRRIDGWSLAIVQDYSDKLDEQGQKIIERIRSETWIMGHLIDDLLKLSNITQSEIQISLVNLSELAQKIVNMLNEKNSHRVVEFYIHNDLTVKADAGMMQIVLTNLINNAWKFTSKTPKSIIEFGKKIIEEKQVFFIRDNGAGFDMSYASKLFTAFQRMHNSSEFQGTGIGLATVWRIIKRHGGKVWAEAYVNQGATFYFTLKE